MKKCQKCGSTIPDQMNFCTACGTKFENTSFGKICPGCGCANQSTTYFCTSCGKNINVIYNNPTVKPSNFQIKDFMAIGFGVLAIVFYQYYIGIGFGVAAVIFGNGQIKEGKKGLGIAGIVAGILGIIATIGLIIG